jgi:hypothetical protein
MVAHWVIVYFGQLFENVIKLPIFLASFIHGYTLILTKKCVGLHFWAILFTNSSGHPAQKVISKVVLSTNGKHFRSFGKKRQKIRIKKRGKKIFTQQL